MAGEKYLLRAKGERFIHNELASTAWGFRQSMHAKLESGNTEGVYYDMLGSLAFFAFANEARINFVGWWTLKEDWPERAKFRKKINILVQSVPLRMEWGCEHLAQLLN